MANNLQSIFHPIRLNASDLRLDKIMRRFDRLSSSLQQHAVKVRNGAGQSIVQRNARLPAQRLSGQR